MLFAQIENLIHALHFYGIPIKTILIQYLGVVVIVLQFVPIGNDTHSRDVYLHVFQPFLPNGDVLIGDVRVDSVQSHIASRKQALVHLRADPLEFIPFCLVVDIDASISVGNHGVFRSRRGGIPARRAGGTDKYKYTPQNNRN